MVKWTETKWEKKYEIEGLTPVVKVPATGRVPEFEVTDLAGAVNDIVAVLTEQPICEGKGKNKKVMADYAALVRCFSDGYEPKLRASAFAGTDSDELDGISELVETWKKNGFDLSLLMSMNPSFRERCKKQGFDVSAWE